MQALKLVRQLFSDFKDPTLEEIGSGADGDVYSLKEDSNKVIKYSVHYCWDNEDCDSVIADKISAMKLIEKNSSLFAKVYSFSFLGKGERLVVGGKQNYLLFSCVMEKLNKISEDEKKVFHSILSHEDSNKVKKYSPEKVLSMLQGMSYGLDFDASKVYSFYLKVLNSSVPYTDLHPRNVMKNSLGEFRLIDFDRVTLIK